MSEIDALNLRQRNKRKPFSGDAGIESCGIELGMAETPRYAILLAV